MDFEYPETLHDLHKLIYKNICISAFIYIPYFCWSDFPLAPANTEINGSLISPESKWILIEMDIDPLTYKSRKLINSLENKNSYILHHRYNIINLIIYHSKYNISSNVLY